jgi:hypothetical protein
MTRTVEGSSKAVDLALAAEESGWIELGHRGEGRKAHVRRSQSRRWKQWLGTENLLESKRQCWGQVNRDKEHGIDRVTVEDLRVLPEPRTLLTIRARPLAASCKPKAGAGRRESEGIRRGIAPVLDRFIRQVLLEVVRPLLDPTFSDARLRLSAQAECVRCGATPEPSLSQAVTQNASGSALRHSRRQLIQIGVRSLPKTSIPAACPATIKVRRSHPDCRATRRRPHHQERLCLPEQPSRAIALQEKELRNHGGRRLRSC